MNFYIPPILRCSNFVPIALFFAFTSVSMKTFAQRITFTNKEATLKQILKEVESQTDFNVFYDAEELKVAKPVNARFNKETLEEVLKFSFANQPLDYTIKNKTIVVKPKKEIRKSSRIIGITGTITDGNGIPIQGVSVRIKGTQIATASDQHGKYKLNVLDEKAVLLFQYLGFTSYEKVVMNNTIINVVLKEESTALDGVVVVGYGTVKKGDLTGSVGEVNMKDLAKAPVATMEQALAGRIAGVQVSSDEGQPGGGMNIVIRGGNSLTQSNSPLYVIDGFPVEDAISSVLNPKDIESVTVLKDASATAIYGSRGANGVIVVETKKGKIGLPVLSYDGSIGFQDVTNKMDLMSAYDFVKYQLEINPAIATSTYLTGPNRVLDDYHQIKPIDWQDKMFSLAPLQIHNLSLSGGTDQTKYSISGSIFDQEGVIVNSGYNRYQGRFLLDQRISKKLRLFVNLNTSSEKSYGQPVSSSRSTSGQAYSTYLMYQIWGYRPIPTEGTDLEENPIDESANDSRFNPYLSAKNEIRKQTTSTLFANARINYSISKNFDLAIRGGVNNRTLLNESFYNELTSRGYPFPDNTRGVNGSIYNTYLNTWVNENILTYKNQINKNNFLDVVGGVTFQSNKYKRNGYEAQRVPNPELGISGLDQGELTSLASLDSENTLVSFLSRVNYNYKSKYLFTASFRADASSKFAKGHKWGYFPSAAFAWNMGKEDFMKSSDFISDAKFRVSYGITGNNRVTDFPYLSSLTMPYNNYYSYNNEIPSNGILPTTYGNEDLKWESTAQVDIGYDISFFKNRVNLVVDLYRKNTNDLLLNAVVPYSTGYGKILKNIGKVRNQGIELSLSTVNVKTKNFEWSSDFNIAFNNNKILELAEGQQTLISSVNFPASYTEAQLFLAKVGGPAATFFGYEWLGNYQVEDFDVLSGGTYQLKSNVASNGTPRQNIKPGDIKYKDFNADGIVNDKDRVYIGRAIPIHIGGFNNNFTYKSLSLNVFFQWSYGNDIFNANRDMFEGNAYNRSNLNQYATYVDRWTPENPGNKYFRPGGQGPTGMFSSRLIEDGSYLRLKTVSLSYRLPEQINKKLKLKSIETYLSAQNLHTWTNYSGMDPEVSVQNSTLTPGYDYSAYPREKAITFGIKVSL